MKRVTGVVIILTLSFLWTTLAPVGAETITRGQMVQFQRHLEVAENEVIQGDVVSIFGTATVYGTVEGDLVGVFSPVKVEGGQVMGDAVTVFSPLTLMDARIGGDAISVLGGVKAESGTLVGGSAIGIMGFGLDARDAVIQGDRIDVAGVLPGNISGFGILAVLIAAILVIKQVVAFMAGVLAIVIFPHRFERMADHTFTDSGKKTLVGFLLNVGVLVLMAILGASVIGTPLVPLVIPAFMLLEFAGNTTVKITIGRRIATGLGRNWGAILELFVGTIVYILLEVTLVGKLLTFIFKLIGMGQVVDSRFGDQLPVVKQGGPVNAS